MAKPTKVSKFIQLYIHIYIYDVMWRDVAWRDVRWRDVMWCVILCERDVTWEFVKINPAPIRLVFHDPPWAIFSFHSKTR